MQQSDAFRNYAQKKTNLRNGMRERRSAEGPVGRSSPRGPWGGAPQNLSLLLAVATLHYQIHWRRASCSVMVASSITVLR